MFKFELFASMAHGQTITLRPHAGASWARLPAADLTGVVNDISREDGSGHNFMVRLAGRDRWFFVRTQD